MVKSGISDTSEIKCCLKHHVDVIITKDLNKKPMAGDRAFYPLNEDIRNHVSKAKKALELSKFDQQNLQLKIEIPHFSFGLINVTVMQKGHCPFQMREMKRYFMFNKKAGRKAN